MAQTSTVLFLTATPTTIPAKIPDFILRTTSNVFCCSTLLLFSAKSKPISAEQFPSTLWATPPQKYVYPDPDPEFAVAETRKFREELKKKLLKEKETFGVELDAVVNVCAEVPCVTANSYLKGKIIHLPDTAFGVLKLAETALGPHLTTKKIASPGGWFEEYGGPGTLLVEPFTDMMIALKEKKLPGAPFAARESLLWAQNYVDRDWEMWNSATPE